VTGNSLERDDPRVAKAARELEITMLQRAWIEDDVLFIQDPYDTYEVPWTTQNPTTTLPHSGTNGPAYSTPGGSAHPPGDGPPPSPEPEPPSTAVEPAAVRGPGSLDDFTAIDGVGPSYAQDLHDAELYTYQDLRLATEHLGDIVPAHTAAKIRRWLDQRLV
jgi:hypothetical protein